MGKVKLSAVLDTATGGLGDLVVSKYRGSQVVRRRPRYRRPTTTAQTAAADRMTQASAVWSSLTTEQAQAWRDYAAGIFRESKMTGARYASTAQNEFIALATKFLQASPSGDVPVTPPTSSFLSDRIQVSVSATSGAIRWTATGPNAEDSTTELMIQKLPNPRRKPIKHYNSAMFVQFVAGALSYDLPIEPGTYALAYRFVRLSTGQSTLVLPCGLVTVEEDGTLAA